MAQLLFFWFPWWWTRELCGGLLYKLISTTMIQPHDAVCDVRTPGDPYCATPHQDPLLEYSTPQKLHVCYWNATAFFHVLSIWLSPRKFRCQYNHWILKFVSPIWCLCVIWIRERVSDWSYHRWHGYLHFRSSNTIFHALNITHSHRLARKIIVT